MRSRHRELCLLRCLWWAVAVAVAEETEAVEAVLVLWFALLLRWAVLHLSWSVLVRFRRQTE